MISFFWRRHQLRLCHIITIILCHILATASYGENKAVTVRLKWFHQFQFAGIYAAKAKGFYAEKGLDVNILERDPQKAPADEVFTGKIDFGVADSSLVLDKLKGKNLVVLAAIFQNSPMVLISLAEKKLISPLDFIGKRIMYQPQVDDAMIQALFNAVGLHHKQYKFIPHNFDDFAILSNHTDVMSAYMTDQPYLYQQHGIKINITNPSNYGIDFYGDMIFTSEQMILLHPETATNFREATIKGWQYALKHQEEIVDIIIQDYHSHKSRDALLYEAHETERMIKPNLINVGNINRGRLEHIANMYREIEGTPLKSDLHLFTYEEYLQDNQNNIYYIHYLLLIVSLVTTGATLVIFVINTKLKSIIKIKTAELAQANDQLTREQIAAQAFYYKMLEHSCHRQYGIIQHMSNMSLLSGDLVISSKKTNDKLHVFLGDMTGHGLGAAIGLIPLAIEFYRAVEEGNTKEVVLALLNQTMRTYAIEGQYCAACYLVIDFNDKRFDYWNGGIPYQKHLQKESSTIRSLLPKHMYLGALPTEAMEIHFDKCPFEYGDRLYLFTDGILEVRDSKGEFFGDARINEIILKTHLNNNTLTTLLGALQQFGGANYQTDDITYFEIPLEQIE